MKYKIGDVARILGISTDLLRYYEKKGVVTPTKDKNNDYRYYDAWDINFLMDCLWFKNFGFSIEQIADMVRINSVSEISSLFEYKETELRATIRRCELLLKRSEQHRSELERLPRLLNRCEVADSPELVRYINRVGDEYQKGNGLERLARQWLSLMPFIHRYFAMSGFNPRTGEQEGYRWLAAQPINIVDHASFSNLQQRFSKPEVDGDSEDSPSTSSAYCLYCLGEDEPVQEFTLAPDGRNQYRDQKTGQRLCLEWVEDELMLSCYKQSGEPLWTMSAHESCYEKRALERQLQHVFLGQYTLPDGQQVSITDGRIKGFPDKEERRYVACHHPFTAAQDESYGIMLSDPEKRRFHREGLHAPIAALNKAVRQDFILVDAICGDPDFEGGGHPCKRDLLYAAADPVLSDAFGAALLGISPEAVPYIGLCEASGAGCADLKNAFVRRLSPGIPADGSPGEEDIRKAPEAAGPPAGSPRTAPAGSLSDRRSEPPLRRPPDDVPRAEPESPG